jgi:hypothetical protein
VVSSSAVIDVTARGASTEGAEPGNADIGGDDADEVEAHA